MLILKLFFEFIKIGSFSFGGGMSTLPYVYDLSKRTLWITEDYINNILTISQVTPGPFACNIATLVGIKINGILGAFIANIGFILPAIFFMSIAYNLLNKIKNNKTISKIIVTIRSASFALVITSTFVFYKKAFFIVASSLQINTLVQNINFKAIFLGIIIFFIYKYKKINTLILFLISSVIAILIKI